VITYFLEVPMSILRITVRTFQNEDHANMFLLLGEKIANDDKKIELRFNFKIIQNPTQKNQVSSIWEYENEKHMNEIRSYLSKHNSLPNSLSPKEIVYSGVLKAMS